MKKYKFFDDFGMKEDADRLVALLRDAGLRVHESILKKPDRKPRHVIKVHPKDDSRANAIRSAERRREREEFVRVQPLHSQRYSSIDMLIAREPNEAGYYISSPYLGGEFDEIRFRLAPGGWDHEHCYLCWEKVEDGDEWWTAHPPNYEMPIGLCPSCYTRLFAS